MENEVSRLVPLCSVVIPNYNGARFLPDCLKALKKQTYQNFEVIIVDNGSTDDSIELAKKIYEDVVIVDMGENTGFAPAVNAGIRMAKGEYIILLNNDTVPFPNFIKNHIRLIIRRKDIFSCSGLMIKSDDHTLVDDAGDAMCALGWAFAPAKDKLVKDHLRPQEVFAACGGAAIYRADILKQIGLFDEGFFAYLEDIDIGYRARLMGYRNIYNPHAKVYHLGSATSGSRYNSFKVHISARNNMYLIRKNMPVWQRVLNMPFLMAGVIVKIAYFAKKGFGFDYTRGIKDGLFGRRGELSAEYKSTTMRNALKIQFMLYDGLRLRLLRK